MTYERLKEDLERQISLIIGFGRIRERLCDWDEDRRITQRPKEHNQDPINKNPPTPPTILAEGN